MKNGFAYLLAGMTACAQPAFADWGAVAVNTKTTGFGYTNFKRSRSAARDRAMEHCVRFSERRPGCKVVLTTRQCFAVARVGNDFFVREGATKRIAATKAKQACEAQHGSKCPPIGKHQHCASVE